jgi:hypothetical protein
VFGAISMFEVGVNVFVGAVLGTALGGAIGYGLSPLLPRASSEIASEQLMGGLFRVIGGFMFVGVGIVSFGALHNTSGPTWLPKIAIAIYTVLGEWGVLVILVGAGLLLIILGIRAMLPQG